MNAYTHSIQHIASIDSAISALKSKLVSSTGYETDRDALKDLARLFIAELQAIVYITGGDGSYLEDDADGICDSLDNAYNDAIVSRDDPDVDHYDFPSRSVVRSVARDMARI